MADEFWERAAQQDPLWAILSDPTKKDRGWDLETFFEHGRREIALLHQRLRLLRRVPRTGRALDFGCGVGRLTQALAPSFDEVIGVDASPTMIRLANELNQHGGKVRYLLNTSPVLEGVASNSIDLLYTDIVLQHLEPVRAMGYIVDFMRVLAPSGIAVFQLPSRKRTAAELPERPEPMASHAYRARIEIVEPLPASLHPGHTAVVTVRVANVSGTPWDQTRHGLMRAGNHWRNAAGDMVVQDDGRVTLPADMSQPVTLPLEITAPDVPGQYICEIDLVHEGMSWFGDRGSEIVRGTVSVDASDPPSTASGIVPDVASSAGLDINALLPPPSATPMEPFPMFGVSRAVVEELIRTLGGQLFRVDDDERAGPEWESHMYFVAKPS